MAGAKVSIVNRDNSMHWTRHDRRRRRRDRPGHPVSRAPLHGEDDYAEWQQPDFVVIAEKDGDVAYVGSDWNEGIEPWDFGVHVQPRRSRADAARHGVQRSRRLPARRRSALQGDPPQNTPSGIRLLRRGTPVFITLRDSQNRVVDERTVKVNAWSSAEWTMTLPAEGALGNYSVRAMLESDRPKPKAPEDVQPGDDA